MKDPIDMAAQHAPQKPLSSLTVSAAPGVEPELFCAAPRRVIGSAYIRRWLYSGNLIPGFLLLAYYLYITPVYLQQRGGAIICVIIAVGVMGAWLATEINAHRCRHLLRSGYAARATVEKYSPPLSDGECYDIGYSYTHPDRYTVRENVRFTIHEAKGVGEFRIGTTFTVLLDAREKFADPLPYFLIRGAEIPGASGIKTIPPPD
jgi:hypothetical protein